MDDTQLGLLFKKLNDSVNFVDDLKKLLINLKKQNDTNARLLDVKQQRIMELTDDLHKARNSRDLTKGWARSEERRRLDLKSKFGLLLQENLILKQDQQLSAQRICRADLCARLYRQEVVKLREHILGLEAEFDERII